MFAVAPWLIFGSGFLARDFQSQITERVVKRRVRTFATTVPLFDCALHGFLLTAVVLEHFVPQILVGFRVRPSPVQFIVWKRHRRMFGRSAQDAVDLCGNPLDALEQNGMVLRRLATEAVALESLDHLVERLLHP